MFVHQLAVKRGDGYPRIGGTERERCIKVAGNDDVREQRTHKRFETGVAHADDGQRRSRLPRGPVATGTWLTGKAQRFTTKFICLRRACPAGLDLLSCPR